MKTLIAYYSRTGTNEEAAKELQRKLGCDIECIIDKTERKGIIGWIFAGRDASQQRKTELGPLEKDPADYDLVVVASPVWAGNVPPATRTYLSENADKFKEIALLSISAGGKGNLKAVEQFKELTGKKLVAELMMKKEEMKDGSKIDGFVKEIKR